MVSLAELDQLPETSGIYLVTTAEGVVVYVGQSRNLYKRWKGGHHKLADLVATYGSGLLIRWVELPEWLLNRSEHSTYSSYKPAMNRCTPPVV